MNYVCVRVDYSGAEGGGGDGVRGLPRGVRGIKERGRQGGV